MGPVGGALVAGALHIGLTGAAVMQDGADDAAETATAVASRPSYPLRPVPAGTYTIGCTKGQGRDCHEDETSHKVKLTRSILVGETEVTQALYAAVMGSNPAGFAACGACPVENISWYDAVALANALSALEGLEPCYVIAGESVSWPQGPACLGYRLPTEAEWEVSARAGRDYKYAGGGDVDEVGWVDDNSGGQAHPVGQKPANGYGLYDMSGNVREWVWDWYGEYPSGKGTDPSGPASGSYRAYRGGGWRFGPQGARVTDRNGFAPGSRSDVLGVRLLRTAP
jgi:formylglycine-generating enzyme required for sulfatase activity